MKIEEYMYSNVYNNQFAFRLQSRYLLGGCHILEPRGAPKFLKNWLGNAHSLYHAGDI